MAAIGEIGRKQLFEKFLPIFLGDLTDVAASDTAVASFTVPRNMELVSVSVAYASADGVTSALTVKVRRGTTDLASVTTTAGTAATAACGTEVSQFISACERLNISIASVNATDDFTDVTVTVTLIPAGEG